MPNLAVGLPSTVFGKEYTINADLLEMGSDNKPAAFGDWSYMTLRDVPDVHVIREGAGHESDVGRRERLFVVRALYEVNERDRNAAGDVDAADDRGEQREPPSAEAPVRIS